MRPSVVQARPPMPSILPEVTCTAASGSFPGPTQTLTLMSLWTARKERESEPTLRDKSEEHTSELQSRGHLVCRLLLEKKKQVSKQPVPNHPCHHHRR